MMRSDSSTVGSGRIVATGMPLPNANETAPCSAPVSSEMTRSAPGDSRHFLFLRRLSVIFVSVDDMIV